MNRAQVEKLVRWALSGLGGFLVGWAASRGNQWGDIISNLLSSELVIGLLTSAGVGLWAWVSGRIPAIAALVDSIAKQPDTPIQAIVMAKTTEGVALAQSLPGNTTVVAGTAAANEMAKAA